MHIPAAPWRAYVRKRREEERRGGERRGEREKRRGEREERRERRVEKSRGECTVYALRCATCAAYCVVWCSIGGCVAVEASCTGDIY